MGDRLPPKENPALEYQAIRPAVREAIIADAELDELDNLVDQIAQENTRDGNAEQVDRDIRLGTANAPRTAEVRPSAMPSLSMSHRWPRHIAQSPCRRPVSHRRMRENA